METVTIEAGGWLVGVRTDTPSAAERLKGHLAQRATHHPSAPPHYSVVAPHIALGHGTLYRGKQPVAESRRLSVLLSRLDAELASLNVPEGMIRVVAHSVQGGDGVVLIAGDPPQLGRRMTVHNGDVLWVSSDGLTVTRCEDGSVRPLRGVVVNHSMVMQHLLEPLAVPTTPTSTVQWLQALGRLANDGRLISATDRDLRAAVTRLLAAS